MTDPEYLSDAEYDAQLISEWLAADPRYRGGPPESCVIDTYDLATDNPEARKLLAEKMVALAQVHVRSYMRDGHQVKAYVRDSGKSVNAFGKVIHGRAAANIQALRDEPWHKGASEKSSEHPWNWLPGIEDLLKPVHGGGVIRATPKEQELKVRQAEKRRAAFAKKTGPLKYKPRSDIEQTTVLQLVKSFRGGLARSNSGLGSERIDPIGDSGSARLTFKNGVRAITRYKRDHGYGTQIKPTNSQDILSQEVGEAVGAPIANGFVDSKGDLITELVPGEIANQYLEREGGDKLMSLVQSPEGRALGLFDYATLQADRHLANYLITPEGHIVGIDHNVSWGNTVSSPFTEANAGTYSEDEIKDFMAKVAQVRDKLEQSALISHRGLAYGAPSGSEAFAGMMARLQYMLDHEGAFDPDVKSYRNRVVQSTNGHWVFLAQVHVKAYMRDGYHVNAYTRGGPNKRPVKNVPGQLELPLDIPESKHKGIIYEPRSKFEQTSVEELRKSYASGIEDIRQIGFSATGFVTFNDGREAIIRIPEEDAEEDRDPDQVESDADSQLVGEAVGAPIAHGFVDDDGDLITELVPGEVENEYRRGRDGYQVRNLLTSSEGRALGLFDYAINNTDRHWGNWLITPEGHIVGIDHNMAWGYRPVYNTSPFVLYNKGTYTPDEIRDFMDKVKSLHFYHHAEMMRRLQYMLDHDGKYMPGWKGEQVLV